jgi:hypothetical protein
MAWDSVSVLALADDDAGTVAEEHLNAGLRRGRNRFAVFEINPRRGDLHTTVSEYWILGLVLPTSGERADSGQAGEEEH